MQPVRHKEHILLHLIMVGWIFFVHLRFYLKVSTIQNIFSFSSYEQEREPNMSIAIGLLKEGSRMEGTLDFDLTT